jgi:hypothetical protein
MIKSRPKAFDCVQTMRQARDRLNTEIGHKSYEDIVSWLRSYRYSDPFLRRLAERVAQVTRRSSGRALRARR